MKELVWILPIIVSISIVLGGCRARTVTGIAVEAGKSFTRIVIGVLLLIVALEVVLWIIPRIS